MIKARTGADDRYSKVSTMRITKLTTATLAAAGAVTLLALAGCSSSADGVPDAEEMPAKPKGAVYDFTQINGMPAAKEITFKIPDALVKTDPEYAKGRVLTSVTAKAHKLETAEFCAVDLTFTYAAGVRDRVLNSKWYDPYSKTTADGELQAETNPPPTQKIGYAASDGDEPEVGKPDPSNPDFGTDREYITDDFRTLTKIVECASGPTDDEDNTDVFFNQLTEGPSTQPGTIAADDFGTAEIAVMKNGDLSIVEGEINDWMLDANGDWIPDD